MRQDIPADWLEWIRLNIGRGCDRDGIARILFDKGFHPAAIVAAMQYLPQSGELIAAMNQKLASAAVSVPAGTAETDSAHAAIDDVVLPFAQRLQTGKAHFYLVAGFLSAAESDELVRRIRQRNRDSTITNPAEPDKYFRTSKTADLSVDPDAFIDDVDRRIAEYMGFERERSEGIQGQYYQVGDQFKTHTDYFEPGTSEYHKFAGVRGQRTWTFMIYLNDVEEGGQTEFPQLGISVTPRKGMAVVWNNLRTDGTVNPDTAHWARPVVLGEKFIITKWFRTYGSLTKPYRPAAWRKIPVFTREGFRKGAIPPALMERISAFYTTRRAASLPEESDAIGTFIRTEDKRCPSRMIELTDELRTEVRAAMLPVLQNWVARALKMTAVYGIREYQRGAILDLHIDRLETHIVSAILNIAQDVDTDWPLTIEDHVGRRHDVLLKPGEMLLYESARLKHGRPTPLDGTCFANVFVHAMPSDTQK